jgi:hypothetical protein
MADVSEEAQQQAVDQVEEGSAAQLIAADGQPQNNDVHDHDDGAVNEAPNAADADEAVEGDADNEKPAENGESERVFTQADLEDVVKIQSIIRGRQARALAEENRRSREEESRRRANLPPVPMPDDTECGFVVDAFKPRAAPPGYMFLTEQRRNRDGHSSSNLHPCFAKVDYSKLMIEEMSADTRGMQKVYTRMLKTKGWL